MDDTFRILSNDQRRRLLVALLDHDAESDEPLTIPYDIPFEDDDAENSHVALIHTHCPMLEAAGVITWNSSTNDVSRGPRFEEIRPFLELLDEEADELPGKWV